MKALTKKEMAVMKAAGAVFLKKPGTKQENPESVVTSHRPLDDTVGEVIKAAGDVISAAEARMQSDTALADRIAEAINANKTRPMAYRCVVHRGKDKLLSNIDIIPVETKR